MFTTILGGSGPRKKGGGGRRERERESQASKEMIKFSYNITTYFEI